MVQKCHKMHSSSKFNFQNTFSLTTLLIFFVNGFIKRYLSGEHFKWSRFSLNILIFELWWSKSSTKCIYKYTCFTGLHTTIHDRHILTHKHIHAHHTNTCTTHTTYTNTYTHTTHIYLSMKKCNLKTATCVVFVYLSILPFIVFEVLPSFIFRKIGANVCSNDFWE